MKSVLLTVSGVWGETGPEGGEYLRAARTPHLDALAARGQVGGAHLLPEDFSDAAQTEAAHIAARLSLLGCDPRRHRVSVGALEAVARGVRLEARDLAFSCWLVGTDGETLLGAEPEGLTEEDGWSLIERAREKLGRRQIEFFPGAVNRHTLRWADTTTDVGTRDPRQVVGEPFAQNLPTGSGAERLQELMWDSLDLLDSHPVNRRRRDQGLIPANLLWPFAPGRLPELPDFLTQYRRVGAVLTGDELLAGAARLMGVRCAPVGTDWAQVPPRLFAVLDSGAEVAVADPTPDVTGDEDPDRRVWRAEQFDELVVGPLVEGFQRREEPFRILAVALPERLSTGGLTAFLSYDSLRERDGALPFDGRALDDDRLMILDGHRLMGRLTA